MPEFENISSPPLTLTKLYHPNHKVHPSLQKMSLQRTDLETKSEPQRQGQETELRIYSLHPKPSMEVQALMPLVLDCESQPNNNPCETTTETVNNEGVSFEDLDLPTAMRKGNRSCTKHPISNNVT